MKQLTWEKFSRNFLALYSTPGHSPRTKSKMRHVLDVASELGLRSTSGLTTEWVARFVAERSKHVCANTIRGELSYLKAACNYAIEEGWLDRAPRWRRIMPRKSSPRRKTLHRFEEIRWLLARLKARSASWEGARLYALVALVAMTGLRRDEALTLRLEDVSLAAGLITVSDRQRRKTEASAAPVPLCPELAAILAGWLPRAGPEWLFPGIRRRGPWTGGSIEGRPLGQLRAVADELGIDGMTWLSLRHTFASHARWKFGMSPEMLMRVLRHTSPRTQEIYVHPPDVQDLVDSVRGVTYRA